MGWRRDFNPPNSLTQEQIDEIIYRHRRMWGIDTKSGEWENCEFADFREAYLLDCDFRNRSLPIASLNDGVFCGSDFSGSNLQRANLEHSLFDSCDFTGANLRLAACYRTQFPNAMCRHADFRGADLIKCDFTGADLSYCDFTNAEIYDCDFDGATLTGAIGLKEAKQGIEAPVREHPERGAEDHRQNPRVKYKPSGGGNSPAERGSK